MKLAAFTAIFLLLTSFSAIAEMYKYTDENGQVVYTQFRPDPGVEAEILKGPAPPPSTAEATQQKLIDSLVKQAETREDRKAAQKKTEQEKTRAKQIKKNCEAARKNLEYLQQQDRRTLVGSDGKAMRISDAQRQQQIRKARKVVERDCK